MPYNFKSTPIQFSLTNASIDYFKIEQNYFDYPSHLKSPFNFKKKKVKLGHAKYLDLNYNLLDLNQSIKSKVQETVVMNFQTGIGKTKLSYDLIEYYYKQGYYVIICSPFIKLVEKDFEEVNNRLATPVQNKVTKKYFSPSKAMKYTVVKEYDETYPNSDFKLAETSPNKFLIHIMTINCLLGNAGERATVQNSDKRRYVDNLLKVTQGKKLVLFFDEIHESVHNFNSDLIPTLLRWANRAEKVFISSATFTPSTIPVIKILSYLTNKKISVYEADRIKSQPQANIHLHICKFPYHSEEKHLKNLIRGRLKSYNTNGRPVTIVTGLKVMAEKLAKDLFKTVIKSKAKIKPGNSLNHINLLTGETNIPFDHNVASQNSIGTSFKTGVNIVSNDGVLFIIFPTITKETRYSHYGIFSDGISSIIQSVGRLRNGGDVHLFIYESDTIIDDYKYYDTIFSSNLSEKFISTNKTHGIVHRYYTNELSRKYSQVIEMEKNLNIFKKFNPIQLPKQEFGFWYSNFHEFLLQKSQILILKDKNPSFGRTISPYILWACIFDQFTNGTLKSILFHENLKAVKITDASMFKIFSRILQNNENDFRVQPFREVVEKIGNYIGYEDKDGSVDSLKFIYEGNEYTPHVLLNRKKKVALEVYKALYSVYSSSSFPNDKINYINSCLFEVNNRNPNTSLQQLYQELLDLKNEFINSLSFIENKGSEYLLYNSCNSISDSLLQKVVRCLIQLKKADIVFKNNAISFLQNIEDADFDKQNIMAYDLLISLSFQTDAKPVQLKNLKYMKIEKHKVFSFLGAHLL